ncbi:hypothetical protein L1987_71458 [Smallanthus sonchifolius]|uniref:Uncharacterized protein n=1 Tax=Smallanthus sonchifolius TaxID=185202 RepID=A0ACB9ARM3_9ASTR|nr:hypothetical protein L1987_71458 [Smallanthus sonchifolius]
MLQWKQNFPPTALAIFCQRSAVSLSYTASAFSNNLFCLVVHVELEQLDEMEFDAIVALKRFEARFGGCDQGILLINRK